MGAFSIRDALPEDAAALISLRKAIFGETNFMLYAPSEYSASTEDLSAQIAKINSSGYSRSLLAAIDDTLIGFLGVMGSPIPRLRHSAQIVVGVLRSHWRQGVGRALLSEAIRWAPAAGLSRLELFVMSKSASAIALYEQLGFRIEGSRQHAYIIDGAPVDDQLMAYVSET